jgi:hypothetical protein
VRSEKEKDPVFAMNVEFVCLVLEGVRSFLKQKIQGTEAGEANEHDGTQVQITGI